MRRTLPALTVLAVLAGACGSGGGTDAGANTRGEAERTASTTSPAPVTGDPGARPQRTSTSVATPATLTPLMTNISLHVEGHDSEVRDETEYQAHAQQIRAVANAAARADVPLSVELSAAFLMAAARFHDTVVTDLATQGHAVGVHADLDETDLATFTRLLTARREELARAGVETTFVSGICSPGPWVEAAIAAGYTASDGMVEWCLRSLPPGAIPPGYEYVEQCATPAECHGSIPGGIARAIRPWHTSTSEDWLTEDPRGELLLIGGSGQGVHCMSEVARGDEGRCVGDDDDVDLFVEMVDEHVAARTAGEVNVVSLSWSIGSPATAAFASALFEAVDASFDDNEVVWATIPQIEAAVARSSTR